MTTDTPKLHAYSITLCDTARNRLIPGTVLLRVEPGDPILRHPNEHELEVLRLERLEHMDRMEIPCTRCGAMRPVHSGLCTDCAFGLDDPMNLSEIKIDRKHLLRLADSDLEMVREQDLDGITLRLRHEQR